MDKSFIAKILNDNDGIFKMIPIFVPRRFSKPGKRLRLHPDDYYALGTQRGGIKERWFSSVIKCMNGEQTREDEGLSYVSYGDSADEKFTLKEAVEKLQAQLLGQEFYAKFETWPMYSKFFDFVDPLFHHVHLGFEHANNVKRLGKPEAYYYPPQYNNYAGSFPHTYFGLDPDVTKVQVKERLANYELEDIKITDLSRAYRIELGSGWYTPPGVLHAPGSYLTYEPQWNSDVNSVYENITQGEVYDKSFLNENVPKEKSDDLEYILSFLDWEKNVEPNYKKRFSRPPIIASSSENHTEKWITYGNDYIAAQELTVLPGKSYISKNESAYGMVIVQGVGNVGSYAAMALGMLRFGQLSQDEYFVSYDTANKGVKITNSSKTEPLVMLKHFPTTKNTPTVQGNGR